MDIVTLNNGIVFKDFVLQFLIAKCFSYILKCVDFAYEISL